MRLGVRAKLVLLSLLILVVVSFSFTWLQIRLSRAWFEEDLRARAVIFAREVAATIGDRREFENRDMLAHKIRQIMAIRQSVFQLDVLGFDKAGSHIVATSYEPRRLPFTRREGEQVRQGDVVSRMVTDQDGRSWEVMAPIRVEGDVVGAIAAGMLLSPRLFRLAARLRARGVLVAVGLSFCFVLAWLSDEVGLAPIVGAFAAGLVLEEVHSREFTDRGERALDQLIEPISHFLVPIFFVLMGVRTDLFALAKPQILGLAIAITLAAIVGKQICGLAVLEKGVDRVFVGLAMIPCVGSG